MVAPEHHLKFKMFEYIFLVQVLCGVLTLANFQSPCWMPAKDFSAHDQEPQGKETRHPVHAARRICPPGKANCEQGIIKWYPELVTNIHAHKDVQVLTYPKNTMSWISSAKLKGNEKFLIVGTKDGQNMRLCRSIVRTHTVIGEHLEGETSCTVKIRGEAEKRKPFELLVINSHGKSMGMKSKVTECKQKQSTFLKHSYEEDAYAEETNYYATDYKSDARTDIEVWKSALEEDWTIWPADLVGFGVKKNSTLLKDSNEKFREYWKNATDNESDESSRSFERIPKGSVQNESPKDENSGEGIWSDNKSKGLSGGHRHRQHHTQSKQPCWSNFKHGSRKYEELDPIAVTNRNKQYLVRSTSKGNIKFGTFSPSQGKIVAFGGKQFSSQNPSVQLLHVKLGSLGWKGTTQSVYQSRVPRNALIVGKFAGSPYALSGEPTYYTICCPDVRLGLNNRKLLFGVASSHTGLCSAVLAGQVVHFTKFHVLTQVHANVKSINAMEICHTNVPEVRSPIMMMEYHGDENFDIFS